MPFPPKSPAPKNPKQDAAIAEKVRSKNQPNPAQPQQGTPPPSAPPKGGSPLFNALKPKAKP